MLKGFEKVEKNVPRKRKSMVSISQRGRIGFPSEMVYGDESSYGYVTRCDVFFNENTLELAIKFYLKKKDPWKQTSEDDLEGSYSVNNSTLEAVRVFKKLGITIPSEITYCPVRKEEDYLVISLSEEFNKTDNKVDEIQ